MRRYSNPASFNPSEQTINVSNIPGFNPSFVFAILDTTGANRTTIYDVITPGLGFASADDTLLTLEYNTSALQSTDNIVIVWDDGQPLTIVSSTPTAAASGQYEVTTSSEPLPSGALINGAFLKARRTNQGTIYVGVGEAATTDSFFLDPGESVSVSITNLSSVQILGANAGDVLCYIAN